MPDSPVDDGRGCNSRCYQRDSSDCRPHSVGWPPAHPDLRKPSMDYISTSISVVSAGAAVAAALFARQQRQVADKALNAAEISAEAARVSAEVSTTLAAIEKDRHTEENRPKWIPIVEKTTKDAGKLWLRMALERGRVDSIEVELLHYTTFNFRQTETDMDAGVVDGKHAHAGQVVEGRSAVWLVELLASKSDWANGRIKVTSRRGDMEWEDEILLKQGHGDIRSSGYQV